jgi:RNA-directed DNA polymerase
MTAKTAATSVEMVAGAVSHDAVNWHGIDWQKVNQVVRRLQVRLVKATQEGR